MSTLLPEWAPQRSVLLTWPRPDGDFAAWLPQVEACYTRIVQLLAASQPVVVICHNNALRGRVQRILRRAGVPCDRCQLVVIANDDVWIRDYGPLSVSDGQRTALFDFRFNGWGGKYPARRDDRVTQRLHALGLFGGLALHSSSVCMEGGALETNGQGVLLARERCLLDPKRNAVGNQFRLQSMLHNALGLTRRHLLQHGELEGDDTDAHIDTLARFVRPDTIAWQACDDPSDSHYQSLQAMTRELRALQRAEGGGYSLVELPWPKPVRNEAGERMPASYANFLIANRVVLVPTYGDRSDDLAVKRLQSCFPQRQVQGVDCRALVMQHGSLHCATMQVHQ